MRLSVIVATTLMSGLLLAGCASSPVTEVQPSSSPTATVSQDETLYTIDMSLYKYSVNTITATPGQTLTIQLTNSEGIHDFVIDELDVKSKIIKVDEVDTLTFTIPEDAKGKSYQYYCSVGNHRSMGMVGTLMVE